MKKDTKKIIELDVRELDQEQQQEHRQFVDEIGRLCKADIDRRGRRENRSIRPPADKVSHDTKSKVNMTVELTTQLCSSALLYIA